MYIKAFYHFSFCLLSRLFAQVSAIRMKKVRKKIDPQSSKYYVVIE